MTAFDKHRVDLNLYCITLFNGNPSKVQTPVIIIMDISEYLECISIIMLQYIKKTKQREDTLLYILNNKQFVRTFLS